MPINFKKIKVFLGYGIFSVLAYFTEISIYCRLVEKPIIFLASIVFAIINAVVIGIIIKKVHKSKTGLDGFTTFLMGMVYFMIVLIIAVFGPTFIDRSISYHIAFLATDKGEINVTEMAEQFSNSIYTKRIHDAAKTGFLKEVENGKYEPTEKAKIMTFILKPMGELTKSLDTYKALVEEVDTEGKKDK